MLKQSITYTDYNDQEVTEDFYFNLSKADLIEMELSAEGGMQEHLQRIVASEDGKAIVKELKSIILRAYGKRSPDGKRFIKNAALREEFESSEAFSELFMSMATDADAAAKFVNGIVPQGLKADAEKMISKQQSSGEVKARKITHAEAVEMHPSELSKGLADGTLVFERGLD